eukprot:s636_g36.t1
MGRNPGRRLVFTLRSSAEMCHLLLVPTVRLCRSLPWKPSSSRSLPRGSGTRLVSTHFRGRQGVDSSPWPPVSLGPK